MVKCLILELKANPSPVDRWGGTPLDDALRQANPNLNPNPNPDPNPNPNPNPNPGSCGNGDLSARPGRHERTEAGAAVKSVRAAVAIALPVAYGFSAAIGGEYSICALEP